MAGTTRSKPGSSASSPLNITAEPSQDNTALVDFSKFYPSSLRDRIKKIRFGTATSLAVYASCEIIQKKLELAANIIGISILVPPIGFNCNDFEGSDIWLEAVKSTAESLEDSILDKSSRDMSLRFARERGKWEKREESEVGALKGFTSAEFKVQHDTNIERCSLLLFEVSEEILKLEEIQHHH